MVFSLQSKFFFIYVVSSEMLEEARVTVKRLKKTITIG